MTDKEKIRAEIEREMGAITYGAGKPKGVYDFCKELLSFIDSLPEEQTPNGYDEAYLNECIAKAGKTWKGVDVDKYMEEVRGRCPKESDDLNEPSKQIMWRRIYKDERLPCPAYLWSVAFERYAPYWEGRLVPNNEGCKVGADTWYLPVSDLVSLYKEPE